MLAGLKELPSGPILGGSTEILVWSGAGEDTARSAIRIPARFCGPLSAYRREFLDFCADAAADLVSPV